MHIITYVTAISMHPKRFICGIYYNTQTLSNIESSGEFVLQLLSDQQFGLIDLLGRKSGKNINKISLLNKKKKITTWKGYSVLSDCLSVMQFKVMHGFDAGDHKCFLCELVSYKNMNEGTALSLDDLRKKKLIRM
jgi:flavin reductase (DIM6/NTAB) family NADH-FMN oxidoreductase RutF